MVEFDRSAFIARFQEEAADLLQRLNEGVIRLESEPGNRALVDQMLRDAHTLKGSSRMVGLIEVSDVAHRLEDVMVRLKDGSLRYEPAMSDVLFEALDTVRYLTEAAGAASEPESSARVDVAGVRARLEAVSRTGAAGDEAKGDEAVGDAQEREARVSPEAHDDVLGAQTHATIRVKTGQVDRLLNLVNEVVIGHIKTEHRVGELRRAAGAAADAQRLWARIKATIASLPPEAQAALLEDAHLLDEAIQGGKRTLFELARRAAEDTSRAATVVADLQEHATALRLLPVSTVFNAFPRAVRDLAREYRKDVDLVVEGGETELDRKVLEEISDPLVHIIRNAVDHGIETVEERRAAGKPERGTVRLAARQEGDHIVIEISDDGAGILPDRIRAAAAKKGYLTEAEAAALSDREATYLIFEKGFSTAPVITELSGRGVGMDVVREFVVERLKGDLDVESTPGQGTTFRLTIPLTLAVIRSLLVRCSGQTFALPTSAVEETLELARAEVQRVEGRMVIRRGRRSIPLVPLAEVLGIEEADEGLSPCVVSIGFAGRRLGLVVDGFAGEQQVVIKALGTHLRRVATVAGVTVLGTGDIVPILSVPDLMERGRRLVGARGARPRPTHRDRPRPRRVLICEDSFTTRELERSIFEAAGYQVETAIDGAAGLALLRGGLEVDAVLTDVHMPKMTGLELTRAIKADESLRALPVVIVTSLEREEERAEGIAAGADAYITKSVFNQDTLLDAVERLIR